MEATQLEVETLAERLHLLETARWLTSGSPAATPTGGRWREQDPVLGALRVRMTDTEVRTQAVETKAAEGNASLYALGAELFKGLVQLSDRQDAATAALGHQLGEHSNALLTAQEDAVALKAMIDTLASGSCPAAAPAADP